MYAWPKFEVYEIQEMRWFLSVFDYYWAIGINTISNIIIITLPD